MDPGPHVPGARGTVLGYAATGGCWRQLPRAAGGSSARGWLHSGLRSDLGHPLVGESEQFGGISHRYVCNRRAGRHLPTGLPSNVETAPGSSTQLACGCGAETMLGTVGGGR